MAHTTHHLQAAERRLTACETCPEGGGACAQDLNGHRPGLQPRWVKPSERAHVELQLVECDKWPEWIVRGRVLRAGVEPRFVGTSLSDVASRVDKKTGPLIGEFVQGCRQRENPNLIVTGRSSTLVAVALLRSLLAAIPTLDTRYVRCPRLSRPLKQHYADPKRYEHPCKELMTVGLLVMVETSIFATVDWLDEELRELVYSRYLENLPTLIATEDGDPSRLGHHYFRTSIPVCYTT